MLDHDPETRQLLAREHQARLGRDALSMNRVRPEASRPAPAAALARAPPWIRLHPAGDLS